MMILHIVLALIGLKQRLSQQNKVWNCPFFVMLSWKTSHLHTRLSHMILFTIVCIKRSIELWYWTKCEDLRSLCTTAVAIHTDDKNHHASHAIYNYTLETWDIIRKTKKGLGAVPVSCAGAVASKLIVIGLLKLNNNKVTKSTVKNFERIINC